MSNTAYRNIAELPATLPVFPLPGALLLPRSQLPLNIFEPRYLNMIDDAMAGPRLVGMVQSFGGTIKRPELAGTGCAGRITNYSETGDGRYLITLTGIARYTISEELDVSTPYRQVSCGYDRFAHDLDEPRLCDLPDRSELTEALKAYVKRNQVEADWSTVADAPMEPLINALSTSCPFSPVEKQALLEALTLADRCETLIALLDMERPGTDEGHIQ